MTEFASKHGNRLHARVAKLLRDSGWEVLVSPYYRDNATDKTREADIIAEREFTVKHPEPSNRYKGSLCESITIAPWFSRNISRRGS